MSEFNPKIMIDHFKAKKNDYEELIIKLDSEIETARTAGVSDEVLVSLYKKDLIAGYDCRILQKFRRSAHALTILGAVKYPQECLELMNDWRRDIESE